MASSKTKKSKTKKDSKVEDKQTVTEYNAPINANLEDGLESSVDGSMRLFGMPHQFTKETDPRIGDTSNLGRCFAERMVLEAPIVALKPGVPDFLPGKSDEDKAGFVNAILAASNGNKSLKTVFESLDMDSEDALLYYSLKDSYSETMAKVNVMCKMMAVFLGIANTKVPWAKSTTFGRYDWRYYSFKNHYNEITFKNKENSGGSIGTFIKDAITSVSSTLMNDTQWMRFYVDSNASFSESASNSTTTSMLESYTEKLEGIAKEIDVISGMTGEDIGAMADNAMSSVDDYIQQNIKGEV